MNEIIFLVEESPGGGYIARALGESIFTESETTEKLHNEIIDAVKCHFEDGEEPKIIRLHYVREEIINV